MLKVLLNTKVRVSLENYDCAFGHSPEFRKFSERLGRTEWLLTSTQLSCCSSRDEKEKMKEGKKEERKEGRKVKRKKEGKVEGRIEGRK